MENSCRCGARQGVAAVLQCDVEVVELGVPESILGGGIFNISEWRIVWAVRGSGGLTLGMNLWEDTAIVKFVVARVVSGCGLLAGSLYGLSYAGRGEIKAGIFITGRGAKISKIPNYEWKEERSVEKEGRLKNILADSMDISHYFSFLLWTVEKAFLLSRVVSVISFLLMFLLSLEEKALLRAQ
ncbi:hypothetical protein Tco_1010939 [Tanacetum coccineum]